MCNALTSFAALACPPADLSSSDRLRMWRISSLIIWIRSLRKKLVHVMYPLIIRLMSNYQFEILYITILTFLFKTMSSVSNELVLVLFLCSILSDSVDRLSFLPSSESPSSFPLSPESISALDPELGWSALIFTFVPNSFEGNPVWTNWDLEWPLLYWYPEFLTTWRASGKSSSRRFNRDGINKHNCAAASLTET